MKKNMRQTRQMRRRIAIAEGAHFRGSIDMQRKGQPGKPGANGEAKPAGLALAVPPPRPGV